MFIERVIIQQNERGVVSRNGRFTRILGPGSHWLFLAPFRTTDVEVYELANPHFRGKWSNYLAENRPDVIAAHFTLVETDESQIAMIFVDGALSEVLLPSKRALFWKNTVH